MPKPMRLLLLLVATLATLVVGLAFAHSGITLAVGDPRTAALLRGFRGLEHNDADEFRWSLRPATLVLDGWGRLPLLLDLRLASPRAGLPPAEMFVERGAWQSLPFTVGGSWRHYYVLVPASADEPNVPLRIDTFRPNERQERIGAALSRLQITPAVSQRWPAFAEGLLALGWQRLLLLLVCPLLVYCSVSQAPRTAPGTALICVLVALACVCIAASRPVAIARSIPEGWLVAALTATGLLAWLALRPALRPLEMAVVGLLAGERRAARIILALAFLQGLVFMCLLPPWQHYDEPAHFEFAWMLANHSGWPRPGAIDPAVAVLGGDGRALYHPPLYYLLISLPLRLVREFSLVSQLYVARAVSLVLFVLTIAISMAMTRDLTPAGHPLRWAVPMSLLLLPTFADLMTSVNSDVGAVVICAWGLWGAVRGIRFGLTARRLVWILAAMLAGVLTKNTTVPVIVLLPLVVLIQIGSQRNWRWRLLVGGLAGAALVLCAALLTGGEPAYWYRWGASAEATTVRDRVANAPAGPAVLRLNGVAVPDYEGLSAPVLSQDLERLRGRRITIGAWVWASRTARIWGPGVIFNNGTGPRESANMLFTATPTPAFLSWSWDVPDQVSSLQFMAWAVAPGEAEPLTLYFDGAVLTEGEFGATAPHFDQAGAGVWDGQRVTNRIRNGSVERTWPRLRPAIEQATVAYIRRSPSQIVSSIVDVERTGWILLRDVAPWVVFAFFGTYSWSQIVLRDPAWQYWLVFAALLAVPGCLRALLRPSPYRAALVFLGMTGLLVWGNVILRVLPALVTSPPPFARYGFPAVLPTMLALVGGWLAIWPRHRQTQAAIGVVLAMALLDAAAIRAIQVFYAGSCAVAPEQCSFVAAASLAQQPLLALLLCALSIMAIYRVFFAERRPPGTPRSAPDGAPYASHKQTPRGLE